MSPLSRRLAWLLPLATFLALALGLGLAARTVHASQAAALRDAATRELQGLASAKASEVTTWRRERIADAMVTSETAWLRRPGEDVLAGTADPETAAELQRFYTELVRGHVYDGACLVDEGGRVRLQAAGGCKGSAHLVAAVRESVRLRRPVFTDLELDESGVAHVHVASPFPDGPVPGAVVFRKDARASILPVIQGWARPTTTGEVLLGPRGAATLSQPPVLRNPNGAALVLRDADPATMLERGPADDRQRVLETVDRRGARVIAVEEPIPATPWSVFAKIDEDEVLKPMGAANRRTVALVATLLAAAGTVLWFWWRRQEAAHASAEDGLRRELAAARLAGLEGRINEIELVIDEDGRIVEANDRAVEAYGYGRDELKDLGSRGLRAPEAVAAYESQWDQVRRAGSAVFETLHRRKDGSTFPVQVSTRTFRAAGVDYRHTLVRDLTGEKAAEGRLRDALEAMARNEQLYRAVAHHFPEGTVGLFDRDLRHVVADGAGRGLTDDPAALVGRTPFEVLEPALAERLTLAYRRTLCGQAEHLEVALAGRTLEVATHPFRDAAGTVTMGIVLVLDVTERRALAERLAVSGRLAALGTLVAGVAHEINNPLAGEMASQEYALDDVRMIRDRMRSGEAVDRQEIARTLDDVVEALVDSQSAARRIDRIVKDLTTFGRPDPTRDRVSVAEVVGAALRELPPSVRERAEIVAEGTAAPEVRGSARQLERVVAILVENAALAFPAGRRGRVTVRTGRDDAGNAVVEVEDSGEGMDPAVMRRIFDPFFSTRPVGKGVGLGLPIAHAIVTAHGGTLGAVSRPGAGSTFRVAIPPATPGVVAVAG